MPDENGLIQLTPAQERRRLTNESKRLEKAFARDLKLSDFEKALLREKYLNPRMSEYDLAEKFGMSQSGIHHHVSKQKFKEASAQLYANLFAQLQHLQFKAAENYKEFLEFGNSEDEPTKLMVKYKASSDLLHAPLSAPASLPAPKIELPEFVEQDA